MDDIDVGLALILILVHICIISLWGGAEESLKIQIAESYVWTCIVVIIIPFHNFMVLIVGGLYRVCQLTQDRRIPCSVNYRFGCVERNNLCCDEKLAVCAVTE